MSSILDKMKQKMKERLMPAHVMQGEDISTRFSYMVGVTMVALAEGEPTNERKNLLNEIALSMELIEDQQSQVFATVAKGESDTIDTIVDALCKKEWQYAFILDLYNVGWGDGKFYKQGDGSVV